MVSIIDAYLALLSVVAIIETDAYDHVGGGHWAQQLFVVTFSRSFKIWRSIYLANRSLRPTLLEPRLDISVQRLHGAPNDGVGLYTQRNIAICFLGLVILEAYKTLKRCLAGHSSRLEIIRELELEVKARRLRKEETALTITTGVRKKAAALSEQDCETCSIRW